MKKNTFAYVRTENVITRGSTVIALVILLSVLMMSIVSCSEPSEPVLTDGSNATSTAKLTTGDYQAFLDIWNAHEHSPFDVDFAEEYHIYPLGMPKGDEPVPFFIFGDNLICGRENEKDEQATVYCRITEEERRTLVNLFGAYFGKNVDFDSVFNVPDFNNQELIVRTFVESGPGVITGSSRNFKFSEKQYDEFKEMIESLSGRIVAADNYQEKRFDGISADYQVVMSFYISFFNNYSLITLKSLRPAADGYIELTPDEYSRFLTLFSEISGNPS